MDELAFNKEYHLAYLLGTDFEKRMFDVYIGMGNASRPPYLEDIFIETSQMQALILLESIRDRPEVMQLTYTEWDDLHAGVWNEDYFSEMNVLTMASPKEMDHLIHDMFYYLNKFNICTLTKQNGAVNSHQARVIHSPLTEVW